MAPSPNPITPAGLDALRARYRHLFDIERPQIVETVSWAAGNGDRSENGDYIYGKRRLREIDRELGFLSKRIKSANVINPGDQLDKARIWFGACVTIVDLQERERTLTLVGDDEQDVTGGRVGWSSPIARALRGARVGDVRRVSLPAGEIDYEVLLITY
ncbi:MAG: GreA/GreB family elongation factor [Sphingomonadaceae bacterium]